MNIQFDNIDSIINGINTIINSQNIGSANQLPSPLILVGGVRRPGLSAQKIASRIISRKSEAGIPIGVLETGEEAPDEIMYRIIVEEIIKAIQTESKIQVAINPGVTINGAGANAGGPVATVGATTSIGNGYGIIQ